MYPAWDEMSLVMALLGLSCVGFKAIHGKQQEDEDRNPRLAEKQAFCYVMQLLVLQSVIW